MKSGFGDHTCWQIRIDKKGLSVLAYNSQTDTQGELFSFAKRYNQSEDG